MKHQHVITATVEIENPITSTFDKFLKTSRECTRWQAFTIKAVIVYLSEFVLLRMHNFFHRQHYIFLLFKN